MTIRLRKPLAWFASEMERKLRENGHKGVWMGCDIEWLVERLNDEREELEGAICTATTQPRDDDDDPWGDVIEMEPPPAAGDVPCNIDMWTCSTCGFTGKAGEPHFCQGPRTCMPPQWSKP